MIIVTSGSRYLDIDAYAGCIAYAKLLNLIGIQARTVTTADLNETITPTILALEPKMDQYVFAGDEEFIIIDVSNEEFLIR